MDQISRHMQDFFRKNKFVILIVVLGIVLMLLPSGKVEESKAQVTATPQIPDIQTQLEDILTHISGVGKVRVMLTVSQGERTIYVRDEESQDSSGRIDLRTETVIISDSERGENGLVVQIIPPVYQGAVIVCQGGDLSAVRLAVVEAVCDATGLTADKISVMKMK